MRAGLAFVAACGLVSGCQSGGRPPLLASPTRVLADSPREAIRVLFRGRIRAGDEAATVKLTLLQWRAERFDLRAADALGRGVWAIEVDGEVGVWSDLRESRSCRFATAAGVRVGEIELPLASRALPAVLLGRLPIALSEDQRVRVGTEITTEVVDPDGGRWLVRWMADGAVRSWTRSDAAGLRLAWEREGRGARLRSLDPEVEIDWREVARAELRGPEVELSTDFGTIPECGDGPVS